MQRTTALMAQWKAEAQSGESLHFEQCKGGHFSTEEEYGLKVVGKTAQKTLTGKNLAVVNEVDGAGTWLPSGVVVFESEEPQTVRFSYKYEGTMTTPSAAVWKVTYSDGTIDYWGIGATKRIGTQCVKIATNNWAGFKGKVFDIQVELGDAFTEYEPSCGGIPSPNPDYPQPIQYVPKGTKVKVVGKNLYDFEKKAVAYSGITVTDGVATGVIGDVMNATRFSVDRMPLNTPYTLSFEYKADLSVYPESNPYVTATIDGERSRVSDFLTKETWTKVVCTFTPVASNDSVAITYSTERNTPFSIRNYAICMGTDATDEPYVLGGEVTVPCDLYEGDIWYPTSSIVEKHTDELVFTDENIAKLIEYTGNSTYTSLISCQHDMNKTGFCTHLQQYINSRTDNAFVLGGNAVNIYFQFQTKTHEEFVSALTDWANNNSPMKIVYYKETPSVEQYDPQPIFAPSGTTTVIQEKVLDLPATLEATMLTRR